ncbi:COP8-like protein [Cokeromyces recurvatus]|uniref:COP8-like protein n=1 Tax=Cokeromyces recurvatus TaxID=90255 RepID=UPI00221F6ECD|nr:COP8-like protein [Cokeromyces recurvatus]KAI7902467.1 COP8-like protein [Cokeromyces recurvatus]
MDIETRLQNCIHHPQQKEKLEGFHSVLGDILSSHNQVQQLQDYIEAVLNEQVGLVIARQLLSEFISLFKNKITDRNIQKQLLLFAIDRAQPRAVSFEESLSQLREKLANVYEEEDDYLSAAKTLQGIQLDSGHRTISDDYKLQIYIRIVKLLLEEDEATQAEAYLNRAALLIPNSNDPLLNLTFKLSQARILDAKRKFLEACTKYHELSYVNQIKEDERILCLTAAVQCAVLAGAGPQRSRSLATLYKDDRTHHLPSFSILEKTYLEHVIRPDEVSEFAASLKPHHLARLSDNTTVFDRAMIEHNLLSASKIYNNITFSELAALLNVSPEQAEQVASRMICEDRMVGSIDQVEQLISFDMLEIMKWDIAIQVLCQDIDAVIGKIQSKYPDYVLSNFNNKA